MRINFVVNPLRSDAVEAARDCVGWLRNHDVEIFAEVEAATLLAVEPLPRDEIGVADLVICFGGDGTLIRAAHLASPHDTPILGVYFGRFGFVTQCKPSELGVCLSEFFDGKAKIETRMMLQADLLRQGEEITTLYALNEMTLQRNINARMLIFSVEVDGHHLTSYPADGVIVSTPTGSTAYNLSAGGPIVDPRVQAILLTALAPHTLSARPLVVRPDSQIVLTLQTEGDTILSADGQGRLHLLSGDALKITRSQRVTRLLSADSDDFLVKLGERLFWSHSIMGNFNS